MKPSAERTGSSWIEKALLDAKAARTYSDDTTTVSRSVSDAASVPEEEDAPVLVSEAAAVVSADAVVPEEAVAEEPQFGWRVHNTFLDIGEMETNSSKRALSMDSALEAKKQSKFLPLPEKFGIAPNVDEQSPWRGHAGFFLGAYTLCAGDENLVSEVAAGKNTKLQSAEQELEKAEPAEPAEPTSIMLRNIACRLSQEDIANILDAAGLRNRYDWIYTPRLKTRRSSNLGYAFINFKTGVDAQRCRDTFDGKSFGPGRSEKTCQVVPANNQGQVYGPKKARSRPLRIRDTFEGKAIQEDSLEACM